MYQIEQMDEKEVLCDSNYLVFNMVQRQVFLRDNKFVDALTQLGVMNPKERFLNSIKLLRVTYHAIHIRLVADEHAE